jgi:hypothetical protein
VIQPGTYHARATSAGYGVTKNGTEQVGVSFVITSSPNSQYDGAELVWYGFFTPKTEDRTLEALITCGCSNLATLEGVTKNEVAIVVNHEPHFETGEMQARIQWINKLGGVAMKTRMSEGEAKAFASKLQGKFLALSQKVSGGTSSPNTRPVSKGSPHDPPRSAGRTPPAPPIVAPPPGDDDIPF